jgi:hypothetical protein
MGEFKDREHYIPLRKSDLAALLCKDPKVTASELPLLTNFFKLVQAVWHFEYHEQLEKLKDAYAPFDPDSETPPLDKEASGQKPQQREKVFEEFTELMGRANFKQLSRAEIQQFIDEVPTDWGLDVHVDLDQFERLDVFARGDIKGTRTRRCWWKLWRKETLQLPTFSRLVIILKLKQDARLSIDASVDPEAVYMKVFKDVPKADLDMLLPGARARLSKLDQGMIIYPMITGVGMMAYSIVQDIRDVETAVSTMMGKAGALLTWGAAAVLGGYGYKSYYSWQVKKQSYSYQLTRSLYYQTLDSNMGVLNRILDEAEEQECRETFLAYFCLLKHAPAEGWTAPMLDDFVELYLEQKAGLKVDFEIGDALGKLEKLEIVKKVGDRYQAVPLEKALERIDYRWDNYFKYNA